MNESEYHNIARQEQTHWWYTGMAGIAADWLRELPALSCHGLVLDVGCGPGGSLGWLTQFGRPYGMDLHPVALQRAAQRGCPRLVQADVQTLPFASEQFHLVTSFDVLCHAGVRCDWAALRELARVLRPGGWLLLRLPAYNSLRGGHDRAVHMRHRYTRRELTAKLIAAGLQPMRVSYANTLLFPVAAAWRWLTQGSSASDVRSLPGWLNWLLEGCLRLEGAWLRCRSLPFGLSVLALARKEPSQ